VSWKKKLKKAWSSFRENLGLKARGEALEAYQPTLRRKARSRPSGSGQVNFTEEWWQ